MKKNIILGIVLILIVSTVLFLEMQKSGVIGEGIEVDEIAVTTEDSQDTKTLTNADKQRITKKQSIYQPGIELVQPDGYINTDTITIAENVGKKVILIDFWTYSCINCQRTLPYLTSWYEKYKDEGFVIIGVHTPEFKFEEVYDNVVAATEKWGVTYPVVQDNNYYTWRAYKNRYWPRKYLIDIDGFIVYDHIGEGAYAETERKIQELLKERMDVLGMKSKTFGAIEEEKEEPRFVLTSIGLTPELYAGYDFALPRRQDIGNSGGMKINQAAAYELPEKLSNDVIYLDGTWYSDTDNLQAQGKSSIILNFRASEVNIVADTSKDPVEMEVMIDGAYITKEQAGKDVLFDGERAYILVDALFLCYSLFICIG